MKNFIANRIFAVIFCSSILAASAANAKLVVNELMPAPLGDEPEWVELFNNTDNEITLSNWTISDLKMEVELPETLLPPKSYAVVTKDSAAIKAARSIAAEAIIIEISLPILNNTQDAVVLRESGKTVDSLFYDMDWGDKGVSLERLDPNSAAQSEDNLKPSSDESGATPGAPNSFLPAASDLSAEKFFRSDDLKTISFNINNIGKESVSNVKYRILVDSDGDETFSENELFTIDSLESLKSGDSASIAFSSEEITAFAGALGMIKMLGVVETETDSNPENDSALSSFYFSYPRETIAINEFLFDPGEDFSEFIELYNRSSKTISLKGYAFFDKASLGKNGAVIETNLTIEPQSFALVADDSTALEKHPYFADLSNFCIRRGLSLNNGGDVIVLRDPNGLTQDSLSYGDDWFGRRDPENLSLEKNSPELPSAPLENWHICFADSGSTPLAPNSEFVEVFKDGKIEIEPNPFSPFGNSEKNSCSIEYSLPFQSAYVRAAIFNSEGFEIRKIFGGEVYSPQGLLEWDGTNENGAKVPPGAYVLFFEASGLDAKGIFSKNKIVVVGK